MGPEAEFEEFDSNNSWEYVYMRIKNDSTLQHDYSFMDSRRPEYRSRNRYRDVSPYDHSRVELERNGVDYINANIVEAPEAHRKYILTQGPLPNTCGHFWLMAWEQNSKAVLMLNNTIERSRGPLPNTAGHFWLMIWENNSRAILMLNRVIEKGQVKCHQYFPMGSQNDDEDDMDFEDVQLRVTFLKETNYTNFTVRTFKLQDLQSDECKEVLQFHYTTWPDFDVPSPPSAFLSFLLAVRQSGALDEDVGPPVIHCSAGIGRSGTFCLVDTCLVLIEKSRDINTVHVQRILMDMRSYRMGLIQTAKQLRFSYQAIIEGAKHILSSSSLDAGFADITQPAEGGLSALTPTPAPVGKTEKKYVEDDSDSIDDDDDDDNDDTPPPLPPRQPPPPPPTSPPPPDIEDYVNYNVIDDDGIPEPNGVAKMVQDNDPTWEVNDNKLTDLTGAVREETHTEGTELRRRNREERKQNTMQQIERMKQRQLESEKWRRRKATFSPAIFLGLGVAGIIGLGLFCRWYYLS